ncbi:ABC transporter permease [Paenibacillus athensensis]|uniref:ABC transporter permease n=1 Tax=Paenibacillus athensensis TaxID=1967502 RepID=A0A4Y8PYU7_9BACL|nr:ABC transporter permease [Paenibacillus athensensis]MCD1260408.1 ABC transporter permease [Paenibacillus athensensis]
MQSKELNAKPALAIRTFNWRQYIVYIAFVGVLIYFSIVLGSDGFLSANNLLNIARQTAIISIVGVAMTFVITAAEIDLSVGSIAALSSLTTALALKAGFGIPGALVAGLGSGTIIGLINGLLVTKVVIPSFLVTLGMMGVTKGLAMWITKTAPVPIQSESYVFAFGSGDIGSIPVLLIWTVIIVAAGHVLLKKTTFGRKTLAVGGNQHAARFSGVNVARTKLYVMIGSGMAAGLAGMLYAGRMHSGRYTFGEGDELSVIAAVILGGTSLFGGVGTVVGTVIGSLMIGTVNNGLIIMGLDVSQQMIVKGLIIILAVAFGRKAITKS